MPIAAKLDGQSSLEALDPMKQAIVVIEHKIRNMEKRKRKIETYREDQQKGQTLNNDQLLAVANYPIVSNVLDFAQDLIKSFNVIVTENVKVVKKQQRKEALERSSQDAAKIREVLVLQDILLHMGHLAVRADFLAGRNKAVKLTEKDLNFLDDLYAAVSPKRDQPQENAKSFMDQVTLASDHLLNVIEGKQKEALGTTYEYLKQLLSKIRNSGYFENFVPHPEVEEEEKVPVQVLAKGQQQVVADYGVDPPVGTVVDVEVKPAVAEQPQATQGIVPPTVLLADTYLSQPNVNELMQTVAGSFNFLQDSELDIPCGELPVSSIPTQTYTNQNYPPGMAPVGTQAQPSQVNFGTVDLAASIPGFTTPNPPPPIPMPPTRNAAATALATGAYSSVTPPAAAVASSVDMWPMSSDGATADWRPAQGQQAGQNNDWTSPPNIDWIPDGEGVTPPGVVNQQYNEARVNRANRPSGRNSGGRGTFHNGHRDGAPNRQNSASGYQRMNEAPGSQNNYTTQNGYQNQYGAGAGYNNGSFRGRGSHRGGGAGNRNGPQNRNSATGSGGNDAPGNQGRTARSGPGSYSGRPQNSRH